MQSAKVNITLRVGDAQKSTLLPKVGVKVSIWNAN